MFDQDVTDGEAMEHKRSGEIELAEASCGRRRTGMYGRGAAEKRGGRTACGAG